MRWSLPDLWHAAATGLDALRWWVARTVVDAVRYRPTETTLAIACSANHGTGRALQVAPYLAVARRQPPAAHLAALPHRLLREVAGLAERWAGPAASALVRWAGGALSAAADHAGAQSLHTLLTASGQPAMLVPHAHEVAILAVDMRGFSRLTSELRDTRSLAGLMGEYLTMITAVVERHRGMVFQYTGDGALAVFMPELAGLDPATLLGRLVRTAVPELHAEFAVLHRGWRRAWRVAGQPAVRIGLGTGVSFGLVTLGYLGPAGKKHVGAIGEPVNVAAFLCAYAPAGTLLVDCGSFRRAGTAVPAGARCRIRSKKPHQRVEALVVSFAGTAARRREPAAR